MSATHHLPDALLVETADRLFAATCSFETVERSETDRWAGPVWDALVDAGFPWVSIPEAAGGSGGSLADAAAILRSAGAHAAPVPFAETGLLGGWLLSAAGLPLPGGPVTVVADPEAVSLQAGRLHGTAVVAWAERAERIVTLVVDGAQWLIVSLRPDQVSLVPGANLAGEPRDTVSFSLPLADADVAAAPAGLDGAALVGRGSLSRVVLSAGALESMAQLAVEYTSVRRQFGKPVGTFQAVQQHLVVAAQCSVRASMAADLAVRSAARAAADAHDPAGAASTDLALVAARIVIDEAAVLATRAVHQAHGAMGVTREYPLHHLSRRLWAWRHEYRPATYWKGHLGRAVHAAGADELFALITS